MVSKLNPKDFRAYRLILDPDDFAIGDDEPNSAPTDLISQYVWEAITTLPGDVAIRTANHQGTRIAILHDLHVGWLGVMPEPGILSDAMLEVGDEFDAAMFNLLHGYYRQAIGGLRNTVEVMTLGCVCEIAVDTETWVRWETGEQTKFKEVCDRLQQLPVVQELEQEARRKTGTASMREMTGVVGTPGLEAFISASAAFRILAATPRTLNFGKAMDRSTVRPAFSTPIEHILRLLP